MTPTTKKLTIALAIVVFLGIIYFFVIAKPDDTAPLITSDLSEADITSKTARILQNTQKINTYDLDTSIFEDDRFLSLIDFRVEIIDVNTGRVNPFEPVN